MLINSQTLARGWHKTKRVIGDTWDHAVRIGAQMDHGMRIGKRLLASVAPILDHFGGGHHLKPIMSGIHAYDQGRADVLYGYNNVQTHLQRIRRQVPELQL